MTPGVPLRAVDRHSIASRARPGGSRPARSQPAPAARRGTPTTIATRWTTGTALSAPMSLRYPPPIRRRHPPYPRPRPLSSALPACRQRLGTLAQPGSSRPGPRCVPYAGAALVAQGKEQRFPKPCVAGSNPAGGTVCRGHAKHGQLPGADSSCLSRSTGSRPRVRGVRLSSTTRRRVAWSNRSDSGKIHTSSGPHPPRTGPTESRACRNAGNRGPSTGRPIPSRAGRTPVARRRRHG